MPRSTTRRCAAPRKPPGAKTDVPRGTFRLLQAPRSTGNTLSDRAPLPRDLLVRGLAELPGIDLPPSGSERLVELSELVARWNQRINLTAHRTPAAVVERLILDSLALSALLPPFQSLVDIGSGAGFPGLPVAILLPDRPVTLVEARERRHHFQRAAVRELALENVQVLRGRAEELDPIPHDLVVAQAVARPATVLGWMLPWAQPGGHLVIPGGVEPPDPGGEPGVEEARTVRYALPCTGTPRSAWIARRR